ncbi:SPOR domain-containing protein [Hymenobacter sp. HSC-4F20]|uniref:HU domain-containing protein n=1 Tax=Hymenobacter sp. HSC-4F20 TaxID=2864135 RepID=UPI001C72C24D|nr:SPOR domain-containing protein [Hymenobacter sp. HSC-4F20]MBX0289667.1 SPOR domain-containing protein [Hymenobacter sp. HSC-4F20]
MLSDHIRTLLRDHDCVIIPDFGGLIADYAPAQIHPVRHTLAPPAKRVAFNQSLTRNDGLLVDALSRELNVSTAQARQLVREAVVRMETELETGQRTELQGVGVFRRAPGRGLDFEYTGGQNLLNASFGLPELVSRPVRATDALLARERPVAAPLLASNRSARAARVFRVIGSVAIAGLVLSANYIFADMFGYLPETLRVNALSATTSEAPAATPALATKPVLRQQADLVNTARPSELAATPTPAITAAEAAANDEWEKAATPAAAPKAVALKPAAKPVTTPTKAVKPAAKVTVPASAIKPAVTVAAAPVQTVKGKPAVKPKAPGWEKAAATNATAGASAATIKSRTGRYYIVAGSYTSLANAEKGRQALVRLGHPARVILPAPGSRQYMLSVADYPDRASADRQASILRKRMGDLWIKNY